MESVKTRKEMDARYQWHLTDIFPTRQAWEDALAQSEASSREAAKLQGHVAEDPKAAIRAYFQGALLFEKVYGYASMQLDEDNGNAESQAMSDRASAAYVRMSSAVSFLTPELLAMPTEKLTALMNEPDMKDYRRYLSEMLRTKAHTLPAAQEKLLAMAGEIFGAPSKTFSMLTDVDMTFPNVQNEKGESLPLTDSGYSRMIHGEDRVLRENAFHTLFGTYNSFGNTIAATYGASVKKDCVNAQIRSFPSAVEASLYRDDIPLSVYDNLIAAVHDTLPALNRYLSLRKEQLHVDKLHMYDLYVPMTNDFHMNLPYPEAFQLVLEGLAPHGAAYTDVLAKAYSEGWIDVYENKNKTGGAYSNAVYGVHPYVLLNHNDTLDAAMTIAHELGHAMHSYYSNASQPFPMADYSLFVAEVASTTNEIIVMHHLLKKYEGDKKATKFLLNHYLEQFRTTVFRQTMFAEFERISHKMCEDGQPLTKQSLSEAYYKLNEAYYGQAVTVDEDIACEWMRIPHFYRGFYVYKYATGFSAAVFLANRILTEGQTAVDDYHRFLSAGSSVSPLDALRLAGLDMENPQPVKDAMAEFTRTVEKFASLL